VKEVLLKLDSEMQFIVEMLDANHLFIKEEVYEKVRERLEERLSENVFKPVA